MSFKWDPADEMDLITVIVGLLGGKLEKRKMPYEIFVADHVQLTPTAN